MALRDDVTVDFIDNGPETAKLRAHQLVDPAHVRELRRRILVVGVKNVILAGTNVLNARRVKKVQREYAKLAQQLGVSINALDAVLGINHGGMHPFRAEMSLPTWEPEFPPRVMQAAWAGLAAGKAKGPRATKAAKQLQLPGTEGPEAAVAPAAVAEEPRADAGPLEVVVRQRGRGEMKFAVRSSAEISKLVKVLEGLL